MDIHVDPTEASVAGDCPMDVASNVGASGAFQAAAAAPHPGSPSAVALPGVEATGVALAAAAAAGVAATSAAAALTSTVGAVAATATASGMAGAGPDGAVAAGSASEARAEAAPPPEPTPAPMEVVSEAEKVEPELPPQAPAWDAHLDNLPEADPTAAKAMQQTRRVALGIASDACARFIDACEFVSLGCFCAVSNAMNLLGVKRNSYPFDWVRSSLEGVIHCLDVEFEDFLTYSTYNLSGQYVIFGGSRWGGSFWHHNVEAPLTKQDMLRRIDRLYGRGSVPSKTPRVFARVVNSSREILAAKRLRDALEEALPDASEVYLLLILDLQTAGGLTAVAGEAGRNILFYSITEADTLMSLQGGAESFRLTSENYAKAVAAAVRCWSGEAPSHEVQCFANLRELSAASVHFDGGDPSRELFTPKRFYGQSMATPSGLALPNLLAKTMVQLFVVPASTDVTQPFFVECFGKRIKVILPPGSQCGNNLQLIINDGVLSGSVSAIFNNQVYPLGPAVVEEVF